MARIITMYISREFLNIFFLSLGAFVGIYVIIDLFEHMDDFLEYAVGLPTILLFFLYKIPLIFYQVAPLAVLLATFLSLALRARNNEIIALQTSGISPSRLFGPLIAIALSVSVCLLILQEYVLPYTNHQFKIVKDVRIKKKKQFRSLKKNKIWYRSGDSVCHIEFFNPLENTIQGITLYTLDPDFRLLRRLDARRGEWKDGMWIFYDVLQRDFAEDGSVRLEVYPERIGPLKETPDEFKMANRESQEMSYREMKAYLARLRKAGYTITHYLTDLHAKISFPFICLVMAILGIPFALRVGKGGGIALGIGVSLAIGFIYWTFFAFCLSLGRGGTLPPLLAAWIANLTFTSLGIYMLLQLRQ